MTTNNIREGNGSVTSSSHSLRLTFKISEGKIRLISYERLNMICPPSIGETPEKGRHSGFWAELHDANGKLLFHRLIPDSVINSIEIHSPEGKIRREFGAVTDRIFEVLLPDDNSATYISLLGRDLDPKSVDSQARINKSIQGSDEIARFEIPQGQKGGTL